MLCTGPLLLPATRNRRELDARTEKVDLHLVVSSCMHSYIGRVTRENDIKGRCQLAACPERLLPYLGHGVAAALNRVGRAVCHFLEPFVLVQYLMA